MFMGGFFTAWFKTQKHSHPYYRLNDREDGTLKCFSLKDLKAATRNLIQVRDDKLCCVKGWIDEHTLAPSKPGPGFEITVRKLNQVCHQEHDELLLSFNNMGQLSHPNLAKLIGYCLEDIHPILVYDFSAEGSLDNHLYKRSSNVQPLSWKSRMQIALDVAKALAYLHSDEVKVIRGDLNTSNILIDPNHNAKVFDFGLNKNDGVTRCYDYAAIYSAPDYFMTGQQTKKGDVYSFGVVLLEIMSGKCVFDKNRPQNERNLIEWAKPLLLNKCKIFRVMDCYIEGQYSPREAMKVACIVICCLSETPKNRPNMDEVVTALEQLQDSDDTIGTASPLCGN
ncbi:receptor-like cytoplasmic kinase 176 [Vicia villosa]|uniref:receptor-like cytoplasmic kinase 176 n=1 Tax=Vicia villosa TaxID=3911 RepID=UPI00273C600A|nr:receptor-like cytoplasmic kinase 176 [Vicia villosa]